MKDTIEITPFAIFVLLVVVGLFNGIIWRLGVEPRPTTPHQAHELYLELRDAEIKRFEKNMKGENK